MMARPQNTMMLAGHLTRPNRKYLSTLDVMCGDDDGFDVCHRTIALFMEIPAPPHEWARWTGRSPDEQPPDERTVRRLIVREGDYPGHDGVYREIKQASENLRYGRAPSYRRPVVPRPAADPQAVGQRARTRGSWQVAPLPYTVQCSRCGTLHTLRAEELGIRDPVPAHSGGQVARE